MAILTTKYDIGAIVFVLFYTMETDKKDVRTERKADFDHNFAKICIGEICEIFAASNGEPEYNVKTVGTSDAEDIWNEPIPESMCFPSLAEVTTKLLTDWYPSYTIPQL